MTQSYFKTLPKFKRATFSGVCEKVVRQNFGNVFGHEWIIWEPHNLKRYQKRSETYVLGYEAPR